MKEIVFSTFELLLTAGTTKNGASFLNKSSFFAPALGVTEIVIVGSMILVALCCAT
jgi:hypothetical protein